MLKCHKETNSNYLVRQLGVICGKCAKEHGEIEIVELNKEKDKINREINIVHKEIREAIQSDCKHKNAIDTGYGTCKNNMFNMIYRCPDCDFVFYKEVK